MCVSVHHRNVEAVFNCFVFHISLLLFGFGKSLLVI